MSTILLDHIAIAVERMADAPEVLAGALGGVPAYGAAETAFNFGQWRFDGGGRIEIIEPAGANGFLHRFLAQRGPGVHHVTFLVPDIHELRRRAEADGYEIVGFDDAEPSWKTFFLHPRQAQGIVIQVAQATRGDHRPWTPPPPPAVVPPPVRLLGLRLSARSRERAELQWGRLLGGTRTGGADGPSIYRWPDSPLRLAVDVDASREEGPVGIEYVSDRPLALPATPAPRLGTVFARVADAERSR